MAEQPILGIDIGGLVIKGALVDVNQGTFIGERFRLPTPQPFGQARSTGLTG